MHEMKTLKIKVDEIKRLFECKFVILKIKNQMDS